MQPHPEIHRILARQRERELIAAADRYARCRRAIRRRPGLAARLAVRLRFRRAAPAALLEQSAPDAS